MLLSIFLGITLGLFSVLVTATTTTASSRAKREKCGPGYGKVVAKDCSRLLDVQVPEADDSTPRQYVPRLSWSDRTTTGLTLPNENTPQSWSYGDCALALVNLNTHLGPVAGVEVSTWQDIHRAFQDIIRDCAVGRGTGGADTVGTHKTLIVYVHSGDSKARATLTSDAVRTVGICPTDFTNLNTPQTCQPEEEENEAQQQTEVTYCEAGNGEGTSQGSSGCSSGAECAHVAFQQTTELLLGALFGDDDVGMCD
ncbi:MAG: hypothetical protein M1835_006474 [Candelina submexicana]|nr:MAG: hypothetical protein M1835_006474 [Candelina submexicana]